MIKKFCRQITRYKKIDRKYVSYLNRLSNSRLFIFLLLIILLIGSVYQISIVLGFLVCIPLFIVFVAKQERVKKKKRFVKRKIEFLEQNIMCIEMSDVNEKNHDLVTGKQATFLTDFNIIGKFSFLNYIYFKSSPYALKEISKRLRLLNEIEVSEIKKQQEIVKKFKKKVFRRLNLYASSNEINWREENLRSFEKWLRSNEKLSPHLYYFRFLAVLFLGNIIFSVLSNQLTFVLLQFFTHLLIVQFFSGKWVAEYKSALLTGKCFIALAELFQFIDENYAEFIPEEKQFKSKISTAFQHFQKLNDRLSLVFSGMGHILLNSISFWDLWYLPKLISWKKEYRNEVPRYLDLLGKIEANEIFANFAFLKKHYCSANFISSGIIVTDIAHPLIAEKNVIKNSIELKSGDILIISGSNMAGKTTFLRTIGINLILAYLGLPVFAKQFSIDKRFIESSLNIIDSLSDGVSFFYAEVKRLKTIVESAKTKSNCIYFIDEMLKGTNGKERSEASLNVLRQFAKTDAIGLFSTHDLELTHLEKEFPNQIRNGHFSEIDDPNQLRFDYKIKEGPVQSSNAIRILKQEGLFKS